MERAAAVSVAHVERVAEAVLAHRRHERETDAGSDRMTRESRDSASSPETKSAAADQSDWGYLPPEPAGTMRVKGVIPLDVKKR